MENIFYDFKQRTPMAFDYIERAHGQFISTYVLVHYVIAL